MKVLLVFIFLNSVFYSLADIPYYPLELIVKAHKTVVLEGEKIGFTFFIINRDKTHTYPALKPGHQTFGQKLTYFNLYNHQNENGLWVETESRQMSNAMVHDIEHYPEIVYLKPQDTLSFEVFFNGQFYQTSDHHDFKTNLFAGYYKFQAFYNPIGTISGDTLYNFVNDFFDDIYLNDTKAIMPSSGLVYYPINITILKNQDSSIVIGHKQFYCHKLSNGKYAYYNEFHELIEERVLDSALILNSSNHINQTPKAINLFPKEKKCSKNCNLCYAIIHREDDYAEVLIKRFIRKNKHSENALTALKTYLISHDQIAFVNLSGNILMSLPTRAHLYIGFNPGYEIRTMGLSLKLGRIGKIPYYSFKNKSLSRNSTVNFTKMSSFNFDSNLIEIERKIEQSNNDVLKVDSKKIPEIWPTMEYVFALSNSRPELGICSLDEIKSNLVHDPNKFIQDYLTSNDPISWCFALAGGDLTTRTEALRLIRNNKSFVALPFLYNCATILSDYAPIKKELSYQEEQFLFELKKTIEHLCHSPIYLKNLTNETIQDYLKNGIQQWANHFYNISRISDGNYYELEIISKTK